jgi:hypothetical protein
VNPSYAFNNVLTDVPQNAIFQLYGSTGDIRIFNNTFEAGPDPHGSIPGTNPISPGSACPASFEHCEFRNNLIVGCAGNGSGTADCDHSNGFLAGWPCGPNCVEHANIGQALNQATAQGSSWNQQPYAFFPMSGSGVFGQGDNLSDYCDKPGLSALCRTTSYAVGYDQRCHTVTLPARQSTLRPATGAWDVGAY